MVRPKGLRPWEPHWPLGSVAYLVELPAATSPIGLPLTEARSLPISDVFATRSGYRVFVGGSIGGLFDVDGDGMAVDCVPWTDEVESNRIVGGPLSGRVIMPRRMPAVIDPYVEGAPLVQGGKRREFPPVLPLWPWGTVAQVLPTYTFDTGLSSDWLEMRELSVQKRDRVPGGWEITAGIQKKHVLRVDVDGCSPDCIPWVEEFEQYRVRSGRNVGRVFVPRPDGQLPPISW